MLLKTVNSVSSEPIDDNHAVSKIMLIPYLETIEDTFLNFSI